MKECSTCKNGGDVGLFSSRCHPNDPYYKIYGSGHWMGIRCWVCGKQISHCFTEKELNEKWEKKNFMEKTINLCKNDFDGLPLIWVSFDTGTERMVTMIDLEGITTGEFYWKFSELAKTNGKWSPDRKNWKPFHK